MTEVISLAVVLAINLFLLGSVIAGGLALSFRFIESASPRLRYLLAAFVFPLAVIVPLVLTLNAPGAGVEQYVPALPATEEAITGGTGITGLAHSTVFSPANPVDEIATLIAGSPIGGIFLFIWAMGCVYFLFREAAGYRQLARASREWEPATDEEQVLLQCPKELPLYFAKDQGPGTIGSLYPVVVLPRDWPDGLPVEAKRLVVRHEMAHAKWRDPLVNSLLRLVRAFFWVSPALWLIERLIESEREAAADHAAIAAVSNEPDLKTRALVYADTLMAMAKNLDAFGGQSPTRRIIGLRGDQSKLENRVRRLLATSRTTKLHAASAAAAFVMALAVITVIPVAALPDKAGDVPGEPAMTGDIAGETINERPDGVPQSSIIAETKKAAGRAAVTRPRQKAAVRGKGGQNAKLSPLSPLRGQLAPLKTDHMAELAPLGPLRR